MQAYTHTYTHIHTHTRTRTHTPTRMVLILILIVDQLDQIRPSAMSRGGWRTASFKTQKISCFDCKNRDFSIIFALLQSFAASEIRVVQGRKWLLFGVTRVVSSNFLSDSAEVTTLQCLACSRLERCLVLELEEALSVVGYEIGSVAMWRSENIQICLFPENVEHLSRYMFWVVVEIRVLQCMVHNNRRRKLFPLWPLKLGYFSDAI